ncbi:GGDEF domain-containing protein [Sphingomonas spermidinifaciens]|uniref:diguanylate cyclase n=2 Tax=Sphingomonas spermidinifaciens TaxID=1141889 RepID=A0A2A4B5U5_9SPHN|nr:GGDEF domain-containing protein [Sphingomonas spermidinifaciens]
MPPLEHLPDAVGGIATRALYKRIGDFLFAQAMAPTPANYALAYAVLTDPAGDLAKSIAARTDGGVRLSQRDLDELGLRAERAAAAGQDAEPDKVELLAARAQSQMDGFTDVVVRMHSHTRDFGRELIASADAIERSRVEQGSSRLFVDDVARITSAMIGRVREAEHQLEDARHEAEELRQALEEARGDALSDPLTGLPNRRAFEQAFAERLAAGRNPCVAVCDVDHFKAVNDRFGHAVGDRVLRAVAATLADACPDHLVARHGGEEFAVLFDGDLAQAIAAIDVARATMARRRLRVRESDELIGTVTFSTGISASNHAERLEQVFERADALLYAAKAAGRDRIFSDAETAI